MATRVVWTRQAQDDLREIWEFIHRDAPATADIFVQRLQSATSQLEEFPNSGSVVPELGEEHIRELIRGRYRIIYRVSDQVVEILTVYHSARSLDEFKS